MNIFIDPAFYNYYRKYPIKLVDIGASGSLKGNWRAAKQFLEVIAFEPDERAFNDLVKDQTSKTKYLNIALYKEKTTLDFYMASKQETSSLFLPNRAFLEKFPEVERFDILETRKIKADTLDNQFEQNHITGADFMKLDTQGSELLILEGAKKALEDVFGLEIEAEFVELYHNQPLFSDLDRFVREFGFHLFDIRPTYWKRTEGKRYGKLQGQIIFADALYLREIGSFEKTLEILKDGELRKSKVLRAVSICILYGYLDYAWEIFDCARDLFNNDEVQLFKHWLERSVVLASKIPNFLGRSTMASVFYRLYRLLRLSHHGWATGGRVIGNLE